MEVSLLGAEGLPKGCLLSVRAGTTRRQAPVDERKFRLSFPKGLQNAEPMKIDLLAPLGGALTTFENGVERYDISVGHQGQGPMKVTLQIRNEPRACNDEHEVIAPVKPGKPAAETPDFTAGLISADKTEEASAGRRHRAAVASRRYLDGHKLLHWAQDVFQDLIREQPADPWELIINSAKHSRKAAGFAPPHEPTCTSESGPTTLHMSQAPKYTDENLPGRAVAPSNKEAPQQVAVAPVEDPQIHQCRDESAALHCNDAEVPVLAPAEQPHIRELAATVSQVGEENIVASQPEQSDIEVLRKSTREALRRAVNEGFLGETLNGVERERPVPSAPQISDIGCEMPAEGRVSKLNEVRGRLRGHLSRAHLDGSLPTVLEPCQASPDDSLADVHPLRLHVRDILLQANRSNKLSSVLATPSSASAAFGGTRLVQKSAPDVAGPTCAPVSAVALSVTKLNVIRKQTREVLLGGVTSGKLSTLLQERRASDEPSPGSKASQAEGNKLHASKHVELKCSGQQQQTAANENAVLQESMMPQAGGANTCSTATEQQWQPPMQPQLHLHSQPQTRLAATALPKLDTGGEEQGLDLSLKNAPQIVEPAAEHPDRSATQLQPDPDESSGQAVFVLERTRQSSKEDAVSVLEQTRQTLWQASLDGRLLAAMMPQTKEQEVTDEDDEFGLRQQARQSLIQGFTDGRLTKALATFAPCLKGEVQNAQTLRQQANQALVQASCDGRLAAAVIEAKRQVVIGEDDEFDFRHRALQSLIQGLTDGRLAKALVTLAPRSKDVMQNPHALRQKAKQALVQASCDGRLAAVVIEAKKQAVTEEEDEFDFRHQARQSLIQGLTDGRLAKALVTLAPRLKDGVQNHHALRQKAKQALVQASSDGRLAAAVIEAKKQAVTEEEDEFNFHHQVRRALIQGLTSGRLEKTLANLAPRAKCDLQIAQTLRQQAKQAMFQASRDGRLASALMPQTKEQESTETLRQQARQALVQASHDGCLAAALMPQIKEQKVTDEDDDFDFRHQARQDLIQGIMDGRLAKVLATVARRGTDEVQNVQALRQKAKQTLALASCDGRLFAALAKVCPSVCETAKQAPQAVSPAHEFVAESKVQDTKKRVSADMESFRVQLRQALAKTAVNGKLAAAVVSLKSQGLGQQVEILPQPAKQDERTEQKNAGSVHTGAKQAVAQSADARLHAMQASAASNVEHNAGAINNSCSDQLRGRGARPDCKLYGLRQQLRQEIVRATGDGSLVNFMPNNVPSTSDTTKRAVSGGELERTKNRLRFALQSSVCSGQLNVELASRAREKAQSMLTAVTASSSNPGRFHDCIEDTATKAFSADEVERTKNRARLALESAVYSGQLDVQFACRAREKAQSALMTVTKSSFNRKGACGPVDLVALRKKSYALLANASQQRQLQTALEAERAVVTSTVHCDAAKELQGNISQGEVDSLQDLKDVAIRALERGLLGFQWDVEDDSRLQAESKALDNTLGSTQFHSKLRASDTCTEGEVEEQKEVSREEMADEACLVSNELKEAAIEALEISLTGGLLDSESDLEDIELKEAAIEALETSMLGGPLDTESDLLEDVELREAAIEALETSMLGGPLDAEFDSLEDVELKEAAIEAIEASMLGGPLDAESDSLEDVELKEVAIEALETSMMRGPLDTESDPLEDVQALKSSAIETLEAVLLPTFSSSDESGDRLEKIRLNAKIALDVALLAMQDSDSECEEQPHCASYSPTESSREQKREHVLSNSYCVGRAAEKHDLRADLKRLAALEAEAERQAEEAKRQAQLEQELECQRLLEKQRVAEERALAQEKAREEQEVADKRRKDYLWTLVEQKRKERHSRSTDVATTAQHLETQDPGRTDGEASAKPKKPSTPLKGLFRRRSTATLIEGPTLSTHRSGSQSTGELLSAQRQHAAAVGDALKDFSMHGSDSLTQFEATVRRRNDKFRNENDDLRRENEKLKKLKEYSKEASSIGRSNERMRSDLRTLLAANSRKPAHSSSQRMLNPGRGKGSSVAV